MTAIRLPFHFDTSLILNEIAQMPAGAFTEIGSPYISDKGLFGVHLLVADWEEAQKSGEPRLKESRHLQNSPYIREVLESFKTQKLLARVHKLMPGASIQPHRDGNKHRLRIHVPLVTGEGSHFNLDGKILSMEAGEAWYLDVRQLHDVANKGKTERIHLVLDVERNAWLDSLLEELGHEFEPENSYGNMNLDDLLAMQELLQNMEGAGSGEVLESLEEEINKRREESL